MHAGRLLVLALSLLMAGAVLPPLSDTYFGDSLTVGATPGGPLNLSYPWIVSSATGRYADVRAVSGSNTADQAAAIYAYAPSPGSRLFMMLGTNDRIQRGDSAGDQQIYSGALAAEVYRLANQTQSAYQNPAWTLSGTWTGPDAYGIGIESTVNGSTATVKFSGDVFTLGYLLYDSSPTVTMGQFTITIDGIPKGTFSEVPPAKIAAAPSNIPYIPTLARVTGCGAGTHTAVITVTSPTGSDVFLDWAGTGAASGLPLYLLTIPRVIPTYALPSPSSYPTQDASVAAYNGIIASLAAQAVTDGLGVTLVNITPWVNPAVDIGPDGAHPTAQGQMNLSAGLIAAGL